MAKHNLPKYAELFPPIMQVINELGGSGTKEEIDDLVIEKYGDKIEFMKLELNNQNKDRMLFVGVTVCNKL